MPRIRCYATATALSPKLLRSGLRFDYSVRSIPLGIVGDRKREGARMSRLNPLAVSALALLAERPMHPYEMYQLMLQRREDRVVKVSAG